MKIVIRDALKSVVIVAALAICAGDARAEEIDTKYAVEEVAGLNAAMYDIATLLRVSEDLVFWQSVTIMGGEYGWKHEYNSLGTLISEYTYLLSNTLEEGAREARQAIQSISRNRSMNESEVQASNLLFAQLQGAGVISRQVLEFL